MIKFSKRFHKTDIDIIFLKREAEEFSFYVPLVIFKMIGIMKK